MDFKFDEQQKAFADAAERVFAEHCSDDQIKTMQQSGTVLHTALWQQLAESGILGIAVGEDHGGLGLTQLELCLILELQGRFVAPVPLLGTLVECALTLEDCANTALKSQLLPQVVSGELMLCSVREAAGLLTKSPLVATRTGEGWVLNGTSGHAAYAAQCGGYVVTAASPEGEPVQLYCAADTSGVNVTAQRSVSAEASGFVEFSDCAIASEAMLVEGEEASRLIEMQRQRAYIGLAALQVGTLQEGLSRAAAYVSERKQFGRPLGAFQAVSQQAADAYMAIEALRSVYWRALDDIERGQDLALSSRVAKYWVGRAGHKAAHTFLHLHGGMGQDLDYPAHRFFLWAKNHERYLGMPGKLAAEAGVLVAAQADELTRDAI